MESAGKIKFEFTPFYTFSQRAQDEALKLHILSSECGKEYGGVAMTHAGQVYSVVKTAEGTHHSVMAPRSLASWHTHPHTREPPSATDILLTLYSAEAVNDASTFGVALVFTNEGIWQIAPSRDLVMLHKQPNVDTDVVNNMLYWSITVYKWMHLSKYIMRSTMLGLIRNIDPVFARFMLLSNKNCLDIMREERVKPRWGNVDRFLEITETSSRMSPFRGGGMGFAIELTVNWDSADIPLRPTEDDTGSEAEVHVATKKEPAPPLVA